MIQESVMITGETLMIERNLPTNFSIQDPSHAMQQGNILDKSFREEAYNFQQQQQQQQQQYAQQQRILQEQQPSQLLHYVLSDQNHNRSTITTTTQNHDNNNTTLAQLTFFPNAFDLNPNPNIQTTTLSTIMTEAAANSSDTSTIEDDNPEVNILSSDVVAVGRGKKANDEEYAYLHGLNSDNLMQFSQQSVMQELMQKETADIKPSLNVLPTFEQHDIGGYKFQLKLPTFSKRKPNWVYSESLNKIYLRMNEIFSIDAIYTPKSPQIPLRIRALLCFVKEVSEPVLRCQNHISKDTESYTKKRESLLRCENPSSEYCGSAEGKSINDRFSVLIPLSISVKPNEENTIKQTIAFKFTCQNSCIGRKETSIIFILESMNGEILSQRVLDVKICTCPKRDKGMDERSIENSGKHKVVEDLDVYPLKNKRRRRDKTVPVIKQEYFGESDEDESDESDDPLEIKRTRDGGFSFQMEFGNKEHALQTLDSACAFAALNMVTQQNSKRASKIFLKLKRLREKALKL